MRLLRKEFFFFPAGCKPGSVLSQSFETTEEDGTKTEEMSKRKGEGKKMGSGHMLK